MAASPSPVQPLAASWNSGPTAIPASVPSPASDDALRRSFAPVRKSKSSHALRRARNPKPRGGQVSPAPQHGTPRTREGWGAASTVGSASTRSALRRPRSASAGTRRFASAQGRSGLMSRKARAMAAPKRSLLKINVTNCKPAKAYTLADKVRQSPQKLSSTRSTGKRFGKAPRPQSTDAQYNVDAGRNATLATAVQRSSDFLKWTPPSAHNGSDEPGSLDLHYDVDSLHKSTIATSVERTPLRYSVVSSGSSRWKTSMALLEKTHIGPGYVDIDPNSIGAKAARAARLDSRTPRFPDPRATGGANVYDVDGGNKATLATAVRNSPLRFSRMSSPVPRSGGVAQKDRHLAEVLRDLDYDVHNSNGVADMVQKSARSYRSSFHPDYPRFDPRDELGRDREVAAIMRVMSPVVPTHGTVAHAIASSERRYSPMVSATPRFDDPVRSANTSPTLGPGTFNVRMNVAKPRPRAADINLSRTPRFIEKDDTYKQSSSLSAQLACDAKHWGRPGMVSSFMPTTPQRPRVVRGSGADKVYNLDTGVKTSLSSTVIKSRSNPHISYRSNRPRSPPTQPTSCPPHLGPGSFSPVVLHHGKGSSFASDPLSPRKAPVPHATWMTVKANTDSSIPTPRTPAFTRFNETVTLQRARSMQRMKEQAAKSSAAQATASSSSPPES